MLTLRKNQIEVFERRAFDALVGRVKQAIDRTFPELGNGAARAGGATTSAPPLRLDELVEQGIERAVGLDLQQAPDIAAFIGLMLSLQLQAPREPVDWMKPWLERPDTPGAVRLDMLAFQLEDRAGGDPALRSAAERMTAARKAVEA